MRAFLPALTAKQQAAAPAYRAPENHGGPAYATAYGRRLARIIEINHKADLAAQVVDRGLMTFSRIDGEWKCTRFNYRLVFRERARKVVLEVLHAPHALFFGRGS